MNNFDVWLRWKAALPLLALLGLVAFALLHGGAFIYSSDVIDMAQAARCLLERGEFCSRFLPLPLADSAMLAAPVWPLFHRFPALPAIYAALSRLLGLDLSGYAPLIIASLLGYGAYAWGVARLCLNLLPPGGALLGTAWALLHPLMLREAFTGDTTTWDAASLCWGACLALEGKALRWGLVAAGFFLIRHNALVWMAPTLFLARSWKSFIPRAAVAFFCGASPWLFRNTLVGGRPFISETGEMMRAVFPGRPYPWFVLAPSPLTAQEFWYKCAFNLRMMASGVPRTLGGASSWIAAVPAILLWVGGATILRGGRIVAVVGKVRHAVPLLAVGLILHHVMLLPLDYVPRYSRVAIPFAALVLGLLFSMRGRRQVTLGMALVALTFLLNIAQWSWGPAKSEVNDFAFHARELQQPLSDGSALADRLKDVDVCVSTQPGNVALQLPCRALPLPVLPAQWATLARRLHDAGVKKVAVLLFTPRQNWSAYEALPPATGGYELRAQWSGTTSRGRPLELVDFVLP